MDREKITLTGTQETMLATLYARALDSRAPNSVLHDHEADEVWVLARLPGLRDIGRILRYRF